MSKSKNEILILGVGNSMRHDDGVGPASIQLLQKKPEPNVDYLDGGVDGLALIDVIQEYSKVIIIDAVNMGCDPGEIRTFSAKQAKIKIKNDALSTHGFGLAEVIGLLEKLGCKTEIKIIGIQPKDISFGEGLTEPVQYAVKNISKNML